MATEIGKGIVQLDAPFDGVPLMLYVIDGGTELAIVDSGISSTPDRQIAPYFAEIGRAPDWLVNTHAHVDHYGGNGRMQQLYPDLRIAAHEIDARWIEDIKRHIGEFYHEMPDDWFFDDGGAGFATMFTGNTAVDRRLGDDDTLTIGNRRFEVIRTSGHSPGHITLFERDTTIAICGDVALGWGPAVFGGTPKAPAVFTDPDAYLDGARRILALDASIYCTGHFGAVTRERMASIVADTEDFVASFDRWTLEALRARKALTLHEVALFIGRQIPDYDFGFHIHASAQATLDRHLRARRARTTMIEGRRHYLMAGD